jgi:hypothetical protein
MREQVTKTPQPDKSLATKTERGIANRALSRSRSATTLLVH